MADYSAKDFEKDLAKLSAMIDDFNYEDKRRDGGKRRVARKTTKKVARRGRSRSRGRRHGGDRDDEDREDDFDFKMFDDDDDDDDRREGGAKRRSRSRSKSRKRSASKGRKRSASKGRKGRSRSRGGDRDEDDDEERRAGGAKRRTRSKSRKPKKRSASKSRKGRKVRRHGGAMDHKKRSYVVAKIDGREAHDEGVYHGEPAVAARRAFRALVKAKKMSIGSSCRLVLRESTQGGKFHNKVYTYQCQLKKGSGEVIERRVGSKVIKFKVAREYVCKRVKA